MRAFVAAALGLATVLATPAQAEGRETLGFGRLFTNDFFGDGKDRWRTGSYSYSIIRGHDWTGRPPERVGELLEYRLRNEILAPSSLSAVGSEDRPYVGAISAGIHTHFSRGDYDIRLGTDVVAVGPQTGVGDAQAWVHEQIGAPEPLVTETQLENAVYLQGSSEVARTTRVTDKVSVRYFVEGQIGTEDLIRAGTDVLIGPFLHDDLLIRDGSTGHLYRGITGPGDGFAFVLGADAAYVWGSEWLPEDRGVTALDTRYRLRGGVHWQLSPEINFFYGATYLSEEFEDQPEGQLTGSLKLNFNF